MQTPVLNRANTRTCEQGVFAYVRLFACSRRILPSPAEAGFKPPHYRLERNEDNRGLRPRRVMYFLAAKSTDRSLRLVLFAAFWSAVNRGLRPRRVMYFLTAKSTKNSPADAFAYFVPSNVRNGRLFAGLQANRPRFLPLLAGTSFHGSGIGPGSFAAIPSFRPGKEANTRTCEHANRGEHLLFACSRRIPASPREAVLNRRILACSGTRTTDSPRARSGRLHSLVLAAPAQRGPEVVPAKATCGWFWYF